MTVGGANVQGASITATATSGNLLRPGTYAITYTSASGYLARAANVGTVNGTANGTVVSLTKIGSVVLAEGQNGISYNFGDIKPVTIGGTVYEDKNDNGA